MKFLVGSIRWCFLTFSGFLFYSVTICAHEDSLSFWTIRVEQAGVKSEILVSLLDLNFIPELDVNQDGLLDHEEVVARRTDIGRRLVSYFRLYNGEEEGRIEITDFRILPSGDLELSVRHQFSRPIVDLRLESAFHELTDVRHRTLCRFNFDNQVEQYLLDFREPSRRVEVRQDWAGLISRMGRFLRLGVEHIFTGYDHIAFLMGLIILGGSLRSLVGIVSSFTVAHSITLILATLNLVVLQDRFVEVAIALSICYIGLENILVPEARFRWAVSFFFGLIHGFGFSNVLRSMELPRRGLVASLFSFNLGVEVGQVMIIAALFPVIRYVHRRRWRRMAINLTSFLVLGLGMYWLIQRSS